METTTHDRGLHVIPTPPHENKQILKEIRALATAMGVTEDAILKRAGMSYGNYHNWSKGHSRISLASRGRILPVIERLKTSQDARDELVREFIQGKDRAAMVRRRNAKISRSQRARHAARKAAQSRPAPATQQDHPKVIAIVRVAKAIEHTDLTGDEKFHVLSQYVYGTYAK